MTSPFKFLPFAMKIFRKAGWSRYLLILLAVWVVSAFIFLSFFRHEPDLEMSNRITKAMNELDSLEKRESKWLNLLIEFSAGLSATDKEKFLKRLKYVNSNLDVSGEPSIEYETLRRRLYHNIMEFSNFVDSQISQAKAELKESKQADNSLSYFKSMADEFKRSLLTDISSIADVDGYADWRKVENVALSDLIQRRLKYLQNPKDCKTAKKLICDLNKGCGYGCQLHHAVYCLIVAYGTERTLILKSRGWRYSRPGWEKVFLPLSETCTTAEGITKSHWPGNSNVQVISLPIVDSLSPRPPYLPLAIPKDLAPKIIRIHGDPIVWWIGQFLKYLLRPQPNTSKMLDEYKERLGFKKPIVGIHIRRTDKVGTEAAYHNLDEYMNHVEEYYRSLELKYPVPSKRVYIATDEPKVFEEARIKYPDYEVLGDVRIAKSAAVNSRYSENSLNGIITDLHFLSLSDFLVCTFSSQVCRVAYEIMNYLNHDAADKFRSLDDIYYYGGQKARYQKAIMPHTPTKADEIELNVGDEISVAGNHWNGFSKGTNLRTYKTGLYPTFKVIPKVETASFPTYSQVPIESVEL